LLKHKRIRKSNDNLKTYHITPDDIEFIFDDEGKKEYKYLELGKKRNCLES
jgi:hypothetical protein